MFASRVLNDMPGTALLPFMLTALTMSTREIAVPCASLLHVAYAKVASSNQVLYGRIQAGPLYTSLNSTADLSDMIDLLASMFVVKEN